MSNPEKRDLTVTSPCRVKRLSIEGIGDRDQVWVHVEHLDGSLATYFNYLDEGYTVVLQQIELLKLALSDDDVRAIFHVKDDGATVRFHAVTVFHTD